MSNLDNPQSGDTIHFTIGDNSNAQFAGASSTQTMNVTLISDQRDDAQQLIAGLGQLAATNPDANEAADEVEQAAAGNDLGSFQRTILIGQGAAMTAIGTDAGCQLVQLAHTRMHATHLTTDGEHPALSAHDGLEAAGDAWPGPRWVSGCAQRGVESAVGFNCQELLTSASASTSHTRRP